MMQSEQVRTEQVNLKLTPEELARLERLAAAEEVSPQQFIRQLILAADRAKAKK
jgi:uncharacterized protein (DUF1778 family)